MKKHIRRWTLRLTATALLVVSLLIILILNPSLTYARKTTHDNYTIFHKDAIDPLLIKTIDDASELLKTSELYDASYKLDICLNDGSVYPTIMKGVRAPAFGWGFLNKVVLQGEANYKDNYVLRNGYKWNLNQLLAHEITHCMQFNKLGFWHSNPMAGIPTWKWEGYAEYVARKNDDQVNLSKNIARLQLSDSSAWDVKFADSTSAPRDYYKYWILVQYCLENKHITYQQLLADKTSEETTKQEMMNWYEENKF